MEVCYKRRFNQSYMILNIEDNEPETYESEVLSHNQILGFLPMKTELVDGNRHFWYEITGKQTLKDYFARRQADSKFLYLLFESIRQVLEQVSDYLLEEENILWKEEYIYIDFAQEELKFVYLPGWRQNSRRAFQELMEIVLQRLDHSDKQATAMAYEMYQSSLGQEEAFTSMLKRVLKQPEKSLGLVQEEGEKKQEVSEVETDTEKQSEFEIHEENKKWGFIENIRKNTGRKKQKVKEEPIVMQYREITSQPMETQLLAGNNGIQGILLYQGKNELASMRIDKNIFIIGKQKEEVDGYIDVKSISRVHAKIEIVEEEYYIEDLNSTNGTYLNGELLEYQQKVKLQVRDRITFGMEEYVFH